MTSPTYHAPFHPEADFRPVVVRARTAFRAARPYLRHPALRVLRADQVKAGDLIVSAFKPPARGRVLPQAACFESGPYAANPQPYDPACGCGVCGLQEYPSGAVVVTNGWPWNVCDPHPADALLLVLPYYGQPMAYTDIVTIAQGGPAPRIDTRTPDSIQHYLTTGSYFTEPTA